MAITLSQTGYCEAADVASILSQFGITATTDPTETEVEGWITEDFNEINARLRGAGFAAPVAQAGGSLTVSAGSIVLDVAIDELDVRATLIGSGGTLSGVVRRGDWVVFGSDAQRYMIEYDAEVGNDDKIEIRFAPGVEVAQAAAAAVTYTANAGAASVLQKLNSLITARRVLLSKFAGFSNGLDLDEINRDIDRLEKGIDSRRFDFPSMGESARSAGVNNAWLVRA